MRGTNPQHSLDVDSAGRAGVLQLEPLVHGEFRGGQETHERDSQAAQGQSAVVVFNLRWKKSIGAKTVKWKRVPSKGKIKTGFTITLRDRFMK